MESSRDANAASQGVHSELRGVLHRAKFEKRLAPAVPPATPLTVMQRYQVIATNVTPDSIGRAVPTDADDDAVIATALAANAQLIVTGDSDLLVMDPFRGMRILKSGDALVEIKPIGH